MYTDVCKEEKQRCGQMGPNKYKDRTNVRKIHVFRTQDALHGTYRTGLTENHPESILCTFIFQWIYLLFIQLCNDCLCAKV
jgi:hypothetical protein